VKHRLRQQRLGATPSPDLHGVSLSPPSASRVPQDLPLLHQGLSAQPSREPPTLVIPPDHSSGGANRREGVRHLQEFHPGTAKEMEPYVPRSLGATESGAPSVMQTQDKRG
jgi:hypothetical protein